MILKNQIIMEQTFDKKRTAIGRLFRSGTLVSLMLFTELLSSTGNA
jgi:hypothetical protein